MSRKRNLDGEDGGWKDRKMMRRGDEEGEEEEEERGGGDKGPGSVSPSQRLACPFYKYNPRKYSKDKWMTCRHGWVKVSRVKSAAQITKTNGSQLY